jgi:F0F1-type ATP synthase epsilon subunit
MSEEIHVKVLSPGFVPVEKTVDYVSAYASDGGMQIYPGHAPIAFALGVGALKLHIGQATINLAVFGGIGHMKGDELTIFSPCVEREDDICVDRATAALDRVTKRFAGHDPEIPRGKMDKARLYKSKARAQARLKMKGMLEDE